MKRPTEARALADKSKSTNQRWSVGVKATLWAVVRGCNKYVDPNTPVTELNLGSARCMSEKQLEYSQLS